MSSLTTSKPLSGVRRLRLEAEGLRGGSIVLGRGAFGTVVLGRCCFLFSLTTPSYPQCSLLLQVEREKSSSQGDGGGVRGHKCEVISSILQLHIKLSSNRNLIKAKELPRK